MKETSLLPTDPPPMAARGLSWVLLLSFALFMVLSVTVPLPETVRSGFVVVPLSGGDPVRAPASGSVVAVVVPEGEEVMRGTPLIELLSPERASLAQQTRVGLAGAQERVSLTRTRQSETLAAAQADVQAQQRSIAGLRRMVEVAERRHTLMMERLGHRERLHERGILSDRELEAERLEGDSALLALESTKGELVTALSALQGAEATLRAAEAEAAEEQSTLRESEAQLDAQLGLIESDGIDPTGRMVVTAPCDGVLMALEARGRGSWVAAGEVLAHVACTDAPLRAQLALDASSAGQIASGQPVRLRYDAFPYLRYGIHHGVVDWVAPAAVEGSFGVAVALEEGTFTTASGVWPVRAGMTGTAEIVLSRRPALAWAFEPLAALWDRW